VTATFRSGEHIARVGSGISASASAGARNRERGAGLARVQLGRWRIKPASSVLPSGNRGAESWKPAAAVSPAVMPTNADPWGGEAQGRIVWAARTKPPAAWTDRTDW